MFGHGISVFGQELANGLGVDVHVNFNTQAQ